MQSLRVSDCEFWSSIRGQLILTGWQLGQGEVERHYSKPRSEESSR